MAGMDKANVGICKNLTFHNALNIGFAIDLFDRDLFQKIESIRGERNNILHQLWIYEHWNKVSVLRKRLENLAKVSNELVGIFNGLTGEIGIEAIYKMFL